jgi:hypothetical protein
MRFAQGKLREGSVASGSEILSEAKDDRLDLSAGEELSSAFEPCLSREIRSINEWIKERNIQYGEQN